MLSEYIDKAMELAEFEKMEEDDLYWGEIRALPGVWAKGPSLEACRKELKEAMSDWIALRLKMGLQIPVLEGIDLNKIGEQVA